MGIVRRPRSVNTKTIDPRKDLQVYCIANKCNSTKKMETSNTNAIYSSTSVEDLKMTSA